MVVLAVDLQVLLVFGLQFGHAVLLDVFQAARASGQISGEVQMASTSVEIESDRFRVVVNIDSELLRGSGEQVP